MESTTLDLLQFCLLLSLAVLLPVVPAYVLYRTLPATTTVSGPFKGMNVQLTGAFAGYFLVLIVVVGLIAERSAPPRYQVWSVTGRVQLKDGDPREQIAYADFNIQPPTTLLFPDGRFALDMPVRLGQSDKLDFPVIVISHPGYLPQTIALGEQQPSFGAKAYRMRADADSKRWVIETPIELEPFADRGKP